MKELKITEESIKLLHDGLSGCGEAQKAIRKAFPRVFKKKDWKRVTNKMVIQKSNDFAGDYYFEYNGKIIFWGTIHAHDKDSMNDIDFKFEGGEIYIRERF